MSCWQSLMMIFCLAIYVLGTLLFLAICIGGQVKKVVSERLLQRRSQRFPCSRCGYFASDTSLKCAVRPIEVMTEAANDCRDFAARS
jgi:hypothetical protein